MTPMLQNLYCFIKLLILDIVSLFSLNELLAAENNRMDLLAQHPIYTYA